MAYSIAYSPETSKKFPTGVKSRNKSWWFLAVGLATVLAIACYCTDVLGTVRDFLIPGDPEITQSAMRDFIADIRDGEAVGSAFTAFCKEIISYGQLP